MIVSLIPNLAGTERLSRDSGSPHRLSILSLGLPSDLTVGQREAIWRRHLGFIPRIEGDSVYSVLFEAIYV